MIDMEKEEIKESIKMCTQWDACEGDGYDPKDGPFKDAHFNRHDETECKDSIFKG